MIEEETYHPRNMTPKVISVQKKPNTNISDNLKTVTGIATAVVSHSITIPVGFRPVSTKPMSNLKPPLPGHHVRIEVTPPPETNKAEEKKHIIKLISREATPKSPGSTSPSIEEDQQYLPPRFTPDGRYLPNPKPLLPKPILKCRDSSEERTLSSQNVKEKKDSAPLANVEPELNLVSSCSSFELTPERDTSSASKVKKKHVRISEPGDKNVDSDLENSSSNSKATSSSADNRRNKTKSSAAELKTEIETDATKCLIHHYSDIVKEFGHVKKTSTPLYLNYEDLKAAAQKAEAAQWTSADSVSPTDAEVEESYIEEEKAYKESCIEEQKVYKESYIEEGEAYEEPTSEKEQERTVIEKQESIKLFEGEKTKEEVKKQPKTEVKHRMAKVSEVKEKSSKKYDFDERVAQLEKKMMAFQKCDDVKEKTEISHSFSKRESQLVDEEPSAYSKMKPIQDVPFHATEKKLHSYVDYLTDVAMFIVACWLYIFKDERLAIPVLALMVYRQAKDYTQETYRNTKQAIKNKIPARWRRKSQ
ncbi:hypothetical protein LSTR_LSTR016438 [Laodelphax striatellus]|nr:hypothetical protein LSTR_LSTR016438 [Laodelphax striatellus]